MTSSWARRCMNLCRSCLSQDDAECAAEELFHRFEVKGGGFEVKGGRFTPHCEGWGKAGISMFENLVVKMDIQRTEDTRTREDVEFYKIDFG